MDLYKRFEKICETGDSLAWDEFNRDHPVTRELIVQEKYRLFTIAGNANEFGIVTEMLKKLFVPAECATDEDLAICAEIFSHTFDFSDEMVKYIDQAITQQYPSFQSLALAREKVLVAIQDACVSSNVETVKYLCSTYNISATEIRSAKNEFKQPILSDLFDSYNKRLIDFMFDTYYTLEDLRTSYHRINASVYDDDGELAQHIFTRVYKISDNDPRNSQLTWDDLMGWDVMDAILESYNIDFLIFLRNAKLPIIAGGDERITMPLSFIEDYYKEFVGLLDHIEFCDEMIDGLLLGQYGCGNCIPQHVFNMIKDKHIKYLENYNDIDRNWMEFIIDNADLTEYDVELILKVCPRNDDERNQLRSRLGLLTKSAM